MRRLTAIFVLTALAMLSADAKSKRAADDDADAEKPRVSKKAPKEVVELKTLEQFQARWDRAVAEMTAPAENLKIPLEFHPNGRIKASLTASRAQMYDDGDTIYATGVKVELFSAEGAPDGLLQADAVLFNRRSKCGYCKGKVSVVKDGDRLSGVGVYFSAANEFIQLLSNCEIRTNRFKGSFSKL